MLMKVFKYGKGRGELATDYLAPEKSYGQDYANRHTPPFFSMFTKINHLRRKQVTAIIDFRSYLLK